MDADETATKREGVATLHKDVPGLDRGDVIGRYVVIDVIGQGGMGIIYAAFDPELDRKVALKLLQAGSTGSASTSAGSQAWLLREAQAMARLSHPNVIAVHDVGTFGDRVFIAMELVEGVTLREWFKGGKKNWRDVISVMRAAGAGLAAAHRAGLVHRDFKPENVLVGNDGRVHVMDFGLARLENQPASRDSDLSIESRSPLTDQLTEAGTVMGTPAYMAPEVMDGHAADARSDQFAFGTALYEALYRARPFEKGPKRTPKQPPSDSDVPAKLTRTVMRAIAVDPAARFGSIDDLLAELAIDPSLRRRQIAIGAAFGVIALGVVGSIVVATRSSTALCTGTDRALAGAWDPQIKTKIHTAFAATHKPWAEAAFTSLATGLDRYTREWTEATVGNCEATRIRGEQTERVFEARQLCLDQRLEEVRSLGKLLQEPTDTLVEKADKVVDELEPLTCEATTLATTDLAAYTNVSMLLAKAHAQIIAGQYIPGLGTAQTVIDEGKLAKTDDLVAEGLLLRGTVLTLAGNNKDGGALMSEATWLALHDHYDLIVAKAALSIALAQAQHADSLPTAQLWLDLATATAGKLAPPTMKLQMVECQGAIQAQRGELAAAIATHTQGLDLAKQVYGATSPMVWGAENQLATTMGRAGAWVAAVPHLEHALALREAAVGPEHPDVALIVSNLGACYDHAGDSAKALAAFKRAFAMKEKAYGPNSPFLVGTLNNIADFEARHGEGVAALADVTRAKAIAVKAPGTSSPLYHVIATTYAEVLSATEPQQARAAFDEVLALETDLKSPELGTTLAARGKLELDQHQYAAAAKFEERSIAAYEATGGTDNLSLWKPLTGLAIARRVLDAKANVKPLFDRAVAIGTKAQISAEDMKSITDAM